MLICRIRVHLFTPDEGSSYIVSTRNSCWVLLASDDIIFISKVMINHYSKCQFAVLLTTVNFFFYYRDVLNISCHAYTLNYL